jgi:alpha-glucosidase
MEPSPAGAAGASASADWWRGAVIYQIYPRSFQDTTGSGVGDLAGIARRLPHVADLGVDAIWISPFFVSPMKDFGYDVADHTDVDPLFGTLADFDAMVAEAHRLGLKVIIDQVLNHTSDRHPWFQESRLGPDNPKSDWYVWADAKSDGTPPNNWLSIFGGSACQYYLHGFLAEQPDLNFHNGQVQDAALAIVKFWLDRGVDGFRLDAINYLFEDGAHRDNPAADPSPGEPSPVNPYGFQSHRYDKNQPETVGFLKRFRALLEQYPGTASVGEIGDAGERSLALMAEYTSGGDTLHMSYTFDFLGPAFSRDFFRRHVELFESLVGDGWACWAFSNHDVPRHPTRWAERGFDRERLARLAAGILLSLRGSVTLYQGEELGLTEAELAFADLVDPYSIRFWPDLKGRDGCRTPMVWEADAPNGGFSTAKPWLPVPAEHLALAVDRQAPVPGSVLSEYRRLIRFRRSHPALRHGAIAFLDAPDDVLAFARAVAGERILCLFNLGTGEATFDLPAGMSVTALADHGFSGMVAAHGRAVTLPPGDGFFGLIG